MAKNKRPIKEHLAQFTVAGFKYYDGAAALQEMDAGMRCHLELEPDNGYDPRAVAVYFDDFKLGFIPRCENRIFYKLIKTGHGKSIEARIQPASRQYRPSRKPVRCYLPSGRGRGSGL